MEKKKFLTKKERDQITEEQLRELTPEQVAAAYSMKTASMKTKSIVKKTKTIKHNTKPPAKPKIEIDKTLTMNIFTLRQKPIPNAVLEQMAYRLIKWVSTKDKIIIDEFLEEEGYQYMRFKEFCKRCPKLEEAYQYAKMCVGNKRERDAYYNKGNSALILKSMPSYSPRWKELIKWYNEINKNDDDDKELKLTITDLRIGTKKE